ncbi:hypothetical protein RQP46_010048 [Phenoliferia psychrophenolica]
MVPPGLRSRGSVGGSKAAEDEYLIRRPSSAYPYQSSSLPRNYRHLRVAACVGWTLAIVLFLSLVFTHPSVDKLSRSPFRIPDSKLGGEPPPPPIAPTGGLQSRVTIVSGFYKIESGKKHSVSDYNKWLANFLHNYETPFEMAPLVNLGGYEWAIAQHAIDPEKNVHVPDVFAAKEQPVWTQAARLNWRRIYVQNMAEREGDCGTDMWFGFEYFADGRDCRIPAWVGPHYAKLESRQEQWNTTVGVKGISAAAV